jgi:hypothetical protein
MPKTAVCILAFNRPEMLERLLRSLPSDERDYYISIDGPRNLNDKSLVEKCISLASDFQLDRGIEKVHIRISKKNQGCKIGVTNGISWGFKFTDALIILEDDINPSIQFFNISDIFLKTYKFNPEVWQLNGWTPLPNTVDDFHFYLSGYAHIWGWSTWKDRWALIELDVSALREQFTKMIGNGLGQNRHKKFEDYWLEQIFATEKNLVDVWDLYWNIAMWKNNAKALSPTQRLCGNLGFNANATHTISENSTSILEQPLIKFSSEKSLAPLKISDINFDVEHDILGYKMHIWGKPLTRIKRWIRARRIL